MFYRYTDHKRMAKENVPPLVNKKGEPATTDTEKTEVLNEFFDSIFTGRHDFHISHIPEILQNQHMYLTEQTRR